MKMTVKIFLNPLVFQEADRKWREVRAFDRQANLEDAMRFLCTPGLNPAVNSIAERYDEITSKEERQFWAGPDEPRILNKIVWPLRHAKAGYLVGNYLGSIALCGVVAEMLAILLFEMSEVNVRKDPMSVEQERRLFGYKFESLGQKRRVEVLLGLGSIDEPLAKMFDEIRRIRRRHLHIFSESHESLPEDSILAYTTAVSLVVTVIGQDVTNGGITYKPEMARYLAEKGLMS